MSVLKKSLIAAGILAGIVVAGFLFAWFNSRGPAPVATPLSSSVAMQPADNSTSTPAASQNPVTLAGTAAVTSGAPENTQATTNLNLNWEDNVDQILSSSDDNTNKVKELFALFPQLPEDGKDEVARHLANLSSDQDYAPLGGLLADDKLPESVLDVLMADVLNRPNGLKLPLLLQVAEDPNHPKASEAKDLLELYVGENYGNDWAMWQQKTAEWLKENPD